MFYLRFYTYHCGNEVGCGFDPIVNVVMKIDSSIAEYSILNLSVLGLSLVVLINGISWMISWFNMKCLQDFDDVFNSEKDLNARCYESKTLLCLSPLKG